MNRSKRLKRRRGFTLMEIIIAVAVLALLGSLSLVAVTSALKYMKKVRRAAHVDQVVKALEIYKQRYGEYPPSWPEFPALSDEPSPDEEAAYTALLNDRYAAVRRHVLKRWPKEVKNWGVSVPPDIPDGPFNGETVLGYWLCTAEEEHGEAPILERDFLNKHRGEFAYFRARPSKGPLNGNAYVEGETVAGRTPLPLFARESYQLFAAGEDGELGTGDDLANFTGGMTVDEFLAENE